MIEQCETAEQPQQIGNTNAAISESACYWKCLETARKAAAKVGGDPQKIVDETTATLPAECRSISEEVIRAFAAVAPELPPWHDVIKRVPTINNEDVVGDVISDKGKLKFAVWQKSAFLKKATIHPVFPIDRSDESAGYYAPPDDEHGCIGKIVRVPHQPEPYGTTADLVAEMKQFIRDYYQAPQPVWVDLMCYYALMTWVFDRFASVPYLRWLGEPETGKTRGLLVAALLCYRPMMLGGATSIPPVFRLIEKWQGTMVIDEADFEQSEIWSEITKVLNQGYSRNWPVMRSVGKDNEPKAFSVFGPKLLSTRKPFGDGATETRCITLPTTEITVAANIPLQEDSRFYERAQKLQNKLLQWRFENLSKIKPNEQEIRQHFGNRLAQIGTSLLAVVDDPQAQQRIIDFLKVEGVREKRDRQQAVVVEAMRRINDDLEERQDDPLYTPELDAEDTHNPPCQLRSDGKVMVSHVSAYANRVAKDWGLMDERKRSDKLFLTDREVGGIIRSLGFKIARQKMGAVVKIEEDLLEAKQRQYHGFVEVAKGDE